MIESGYLQEASESFGGWVETEERVWLRKKWVPQYAQIDQAGSLRISSSSVYSIREYFLEGSTKIVSETDWRVGTDLASSRTNIKIYHCRSLSCDPDSIVEFRLTDPDKVPGWIAALSR